MTSTPSFSSLTTPELRAFFEHVPMPQLKSMLYSNSVILSYDNKRWSSPPFFSSTSSNIRSKLVFKQFPSSLLPSPFVFYPAIGMSMRTSKSTHNSPSDSCLYEFICAYVTTTCVSGWQWRWIFLFFFLSFFLGFKQRGEKWQLKWGFRILLYDCRKVMQQPRGQQQQRKKEKTWTIATRERPVPPSPLPPNIYI